MTLNDLIDNGDPREIKRALAVKMAISGYSGGAIGELLNIVPSFVSKWKSVYYESGTEGLFLAHKGSKGYLTKEERTEITDYIKSKDSEDINELISYIENEYGVKYSSLKSYYDLLHEAGMSWKKTEKSNPKKDESAVLEKREEIKKKLLDKADDIRNSRLVVWIQDECHLLWGDVCGHVWGKRNQKISVPMLNQRKRKTFYGAVNYYTKEVAVKEYEGGDSENTVDFVEYLRMKSGFENILLIWDGASYHKNGEMKLYLEKINKGYEENFRVSCMLFAPNAPEQNPMEDIWNISKRHLRKNFSDFFSFNDVIKSFGDFIDTYCFNFPKLSLYGEI